MKRDPVQTLIDEINGSCRPHILAGINGNIPNTWIAQRLKAAPTLASPSVAIWVDAAHSYSTGSGILTEVTVGAKLLVDPPAEHLKIADALALQLSEKIRAKQATLRPSTVRIKLDDGAKLPERQTEGASGYDLCALQAVRVEPGRVSVVKTGVHLEMPPGMEAQVRPRSGLAVRGIWVHFGSIDSDYRGDVSVLCVNHGTDAYTVAVGDRIAQLVFSKVEHPEIEVVATFGESERGDRGFGSTGR